jgi:hypothetical protein
LGQVVVVVDLTMKRMLREQRKGLEELEILHCQIKQLQVRHSMHLEELDLLVIHPQGRILAGQQVLQMAELAPMEL